MYRLILFMILTAAGAAAQSRPSLDAGIQWENDARRAVAEAQRTQRPLMFWVLSSTEQRDRRLVSAQRDAFADPRVLALSSNFVCARLSRSVDRDTIAELGLPPQINMEIAFVKPGGKLMDRLAASAVSDPRTLAQKMERVFDDYRRAFYELELRPALTDQDATPARLREALTRIREFHITIADETIVELSARPGLDPEVARLAITVLANLSTRNGVGHLVKLSAAGDSAASGALRTVTPVGAELLLEHLVDDAGNVRTAIYDAIVHSSGIRDPRPDSWWESATADERTAEIDRVRRLTRDAAERWRRTSIV